HVVGVGPEVHVVWVAFVAGADELELDDAAGVGFDAAGAVLQRLAVLPEGDVLAHFNALVGQRFDRGVGCVSAAAVGGPGAALGGVDEHAAGPLLLAGRVALRRAVDLDGGHGLVSLLGL